ncbi:MAG: hypothetical protein K1Y02_09040 [Candidatus Hydrogenedentes bacterium]|nr:hypothetical protein [Candidatus Hydrogenedentota bacterium]
MFFAGCAVLVVGLAAANTPEASVSQLFVDDICVARKQGVLRRAHACSKLSEPVLIPEKPWEGNRVYVYGTVLPDAATNGFRMWYMSAGDTLAGTARDPKLGDQAKNHVLYATSADGIRWDRPELNLFSFGGNPHTNIVFDFHSPSIVFNANQSDPEMRYVMFGRSKGGKKSGYTTATSSDGLHWTPNPNEPVLDGGDTCTLTLDPKTGEYLAFFKKSHDYRGFSRRLVYLSTSRDLQTWSAPVLVMAPDEIDDAQTKAEDGICSHFYNMAAFPYGGQYLGFVTHFRYRGEPAEKGPEQSGQDGPIDVQLVHSRDGRVWKRCEDRSPVIPNGPYEYDAGCILGTANMPVAVGDELWVYYTAINTTHGGYTPKKRVTIARAAWPLDRFVSLDAEEEGIVETHSFLSPGSSLVVNADASTGSLAIEVLDGEGKVLKGYGASECEVMNEDSLRRAVQWKGGSELPKGAEIRLRFVLKHASLYSYTIR